MREFEKDYQKGDYHFKLKGFKKWFLIHNYKKITEGIKKSNSVLDIGCGDGRILNFLDCSYFGIDISPTGIKLAKKRFPNKKLMCVDIFKVKGKFDYIISSLTMQYLSDNQLDKTLDKIKLLLKKNGVFRFTYPTNRKGISEDSNKKSITVLNNILKKYFGEVKTKCLCHFVKDMDNFSEFKIAIKEEGNLDNVYHYIVECKC